MRARRCSEDPADPAAPAWTDADAMDVALAPVPLEAQPTEYIRVKWADRDYGRVPAVRVASLHDGARLALRLEWSAPGGTADGASSEFPDAAAVYFPAAAGAPAETIGSAQAPVQLWAWDAHRNAGRRLDGRGPGAFRPAGDGADGVVATASRIDDGWAVVLTGPLPDTVDRLGVAVWDGANEERAGVGAATPGWVPLEIV